MEDFLNIRPLSFPGAARTAQLPPPAHDPPGAVSYNVTLHEEETPPGGTEARPDVAEREWAPWAVTSQSEKKKVANTKGVDMSSFGGETGFDRLDALINLSVIHRKRAKEIGKTLVKIGHVTAQAGARIIQRQGAEVGGAGGIGNRLVDLGRKIRQRGESVLQSGTKKAQDAQKTGTKQAQDAQKNTANVQTSHNRNTAADRLVTPSIRMVPLCSHGKTHHGSTLLGGAHSGKFVPQGRLESMSACAKRCCAIHSCDVAFMVDGLCYSVTCSHPTLCDYVPARHARQYKPQITYVWRNSPGGREIFRRILKARAGHLQSHRVSQGGAEKQPRGDKRVGHVDGITQHGGGPRRASSQNNVAYKAQSSRNGAPDSKVSIRPQVDRKILTDLGTNSREAKASEVHISRKPSPEPKTKTPAGEAMRGAQKPLQTSGSIGPKTDGGVKVRTAALNRGVGPPDPSVAARARETFAQGVVSCPRGEVETNVSFPAGTRTGKFTYVKDVSRVDECVTVCCGTVHCDMAFMLGDSCYTVECVSESACLTRPNVLKQYSTRAVRISRRFHRVGAESRNFVKISSSRPSDVSASRNVSTPLKHAPPKHLRSATDGVGKSEVKQSMLKKKAMHLSSSSEQGSRKGRQHKLSEQDNGIMQILKYLRDKIYQLERHSDPAVKSNIRSLLGGNAEDFFRNPGAPSVKSGAQKSKPSEPPKNKGSAVGKSDLSAVRRFPGRLGSSDNILRESRSYKFGSTRAAIHPTPASRVPIHESLRVVLPPVEGNPRSDRHESSPKTVPHGSSRGAPLRKRPARVKERKEGLNSTAASYDHSKPLSKSGVESEQKGNGEKMLHENSVVQERKAIQINSGKGARQKYFPGASRQGVVSSYGEGDDVASGAESVQAGSSSRDGADSVAARAHPASPVTNLGGEPGEENRQKTISNSRRNCSSARTVFNATLRGGIRAGNFSFVGVVSSPQECVSFCCRSEHCDLGFVISSKCFVVRCQSKVLCEAISVKRPQRFNPYVCYVSRGPVSSGKQVPTLPGKPSLPGKSTVGKTAGGDPVSTNSTPETLDKVTNNSAGKIHEEHILVSLKPEARVSRKPTPEVRVSEKPKLEVDVPGKRISAPHLPAPSGPSRAESLSGSVKKGADGSRKQSAPRTNKTPLKQKRVFRVSGSIDASPQKAADADHSLTEREPGNPHCVVGPVRHDVSFKHGRGSGNFTHFSRAQSMRDCAGRCCEVERCDVALMLMRSCYLVECLGPDACDTVKLHGSYFKPRMVFVNKTGAGKLRKDLQAAHSPHPLPTIVNTTRPGKLRNETKSSRRPYPLPTIVNTTRPGKLRNETKSSRRPYPLPTIAVKKTNPVEKEPPLSPQQQQQTNVGESNKAERPPTATERAPTSKDSKPNSNQSCQFSHVFKDVTVRGGLQSGKFNVARDVHNLRRCQETCCQEVTCDLVLMIREKCVLVTCRETGSCEAVPVPPSKYRLRIAYKVQSPGALRSDTRQAACSCGIHQ